MLPLWSKYDPQRSQKDTEWVGRSVEFGKEALPLVTGIFSPADAAHIRRKGKHLQINLGHEQADDLFRWGLLKEIVQSGEQLVIIISSTFSYSYHREVDGRMVSEDITEELPIDGVTLASKQLTQQTYGKLRGMTSQEEAVSYIYLRPNSTSANHMAHELLGHFYLDVRHVPSGHADMITTEQGILDPEGNPFTGRVHEFLQQHIELDDDIDPYIPELY